MPSPISHTAVSGLNAAQLRLGTSAHNVANANTPGFQRLQVSQQAQSSPATGVQAQVESAPRGAGVRLEHEAVEQMAATYAFKANVQVLRTQDQMMGSLLDRHA